VLLSEAQDVIDKIVYTVCNPVAAELVAKADQWPGLVVVIPKLLPVFGPESRQRYF
jgi:hypothetical protein